MSRRGFANRDARALTPWQGWNLKFIDTKNSINERDLVMVKDPLIDFEEVVVGMRSLGSNPMARGDISRRFFQFTVP